MSKIVPFLIDPVGAATGLPSPGAAVRSAMEPDRPKPPPPPPPMPEPPKVSTVLRPIQGQPQPLKPAPVDEPFGRRTSGSSASSDETRGLIKPGASRSLLAR